MRLLGIVGLLALSVGCDATPASTAPSTAREFLATYNQISCESRLRCCGTVCSDASDDSFYKNYSRTLDYVAAGLYRFDPAAASACLASYSDFYKSCDTALTDLPVVSAQCGAVIVGNTQAGGQCDSSLSPSNCVADTTCSGGTCMAKAKVGESCLTSSCVAAAFCDTSVAMPVCKARLTAGQTCTASSQCQTTAFCDSSVLPRVCTDYGKEGQPCSASKLCDPTSGKLSCLPNQVCGGPQNDGAACASSTQCKSGRCAGVAPNQVCQAQPSPQTLRDQLCGLK
ncbi:MAG TPA: hypothetical protein PKI49_10105 [Pseudomonadota bacterium]|nr:hypothetical protein [Pseudomonadota bacterium]HNF96033.1 hypothetical protein [Pseudomonadota bacterium]HNK47009.1 hypothetical protein [Pseudomonadota bacterium]HNO68852.1 hypothetical protein [Pseudomonadota bacterium]